ncbi:hypothetical protein N9N14_04080 [Candidatus Poseidonia alphae]|uniref:hypothetical protein n=1 Tax=Candidatus Poseidonia alphae TaxID=1915863 RepID=UPI00230E7BDB|nr:hypothetical protein [Candidatus Poseidonia alphae]MDA8530772.1 hypothetical protein [Candidatus Poseidonia alphae]MDA8839641.1 hypothetical protein [Candidatus Poseidonia alphae]MDB2569135.1 hypothetical protein [Candidatus Poseidonia alphae]MDB2637198.1 hypothetical protein [Candidatus Poseidonia alphae]
MEQTNGATDASRALSKAYDQVIRKKRMNESLIRWSLNYSDLLKSKDAGMGFTLYLL